MSYHVEPCDASVGVLHECSYVCPKGVSVQLASLGLTREPSHYWLAPEKKQIWRDCRHD